MIQATKQIVSGFAAYPKAVRLIIANKLGKYLALPVVLNIVVVVALVFAGYGLGDWLSALIERHTENMNGWIEAAMIAIKIVLPVIFFIVFIFIGGTIVNVLMSPIYTMLSEKAETLLTGKEFPFSARQTAKDIWRALRIALKNTFKQLLLTFLCLFLNFIPVIGSVVSIGLIFVINAYYFGSGFMDYTFERWRYSVEDSGKATGRLKFLAITNGAVYSLPLYLFCGTFIAAFIGGVSAVAATISQIELKAKE